MNIKKYRNETRGFPLRMMMSVTAILLLISAIIIVLIIIIMIKRVTIQK